MQAGEAIVAIKNFDECPHDQIPIRSNANRVLPFGFRNVSRPREMVSPFG